MVVLTTERGTRGPKLIFGLSLIYLYNIDIYYPHTCTAYTGYRVWQCMLFLVAASSSAGEVVLQINHGRKPNWVCTSADGCLFVADTSNDIHLYSGLV